MLYGSVTARLKTSSAAGVVSAFILMSDVKVRLWRPYHLYSRFWHAGRSLTDSSAVFRRTKSTSKCPERRERSSRCAFSSSPCRLFPFSVAAKLVIKLCRQTISIWATQIMLTELGQPLEILMIPKPSPSFFLSWPLLCFLLSADLC
jgi:hypothetical protein